MRKFLILAFFACVPVLAADVGVTVTIGEPGFYGQIDIGTYPRPRLLYPSPVIIRAVPVGVVREPRYLRVPPGHEMHWERHCAEYDACGVPVYFVEDGWYKTVYVPEYRKKHGHHEDHGKGHGKEKRKHEDRDHD